MLAKNEIQPRQSENAVERGSLAYIYDEKGRQIFTMPRGNQPGDGLKGDTSITVKMRRGSLTYTYNEKGQWKSPTLTRCSLVR